jgi:uncharacterized membrane protein YccC
MKLTTMSEVLHGARTRGGWLAACVLQGLVVFLASAWPLPAPAAAAPGQNSATAAAPARPAVRHRRVKFSLDDQVRAMAKALDLDAQQQAELKLLLQTQLEELVKASNDADPPEADRVQVIEALGARLIERVMALLNDEQKKNFSPSSLRHDGAGAADGSDAQRAMSAAESK